MITFILLAAYATGVVLAFGAAYWLMREWPRNGFIVDPAPRPETLEWRRARNIIMVPISALGFYLYFNHRYVDPLTDPEATSVMFSPWHLFGFHWVSKFSPAIEVAAVDSFLGVFVFLWQGAAKAVSFTASYVDVVIPIPSVALILTSLAAIALIGLLLFVLGESIAIILAVGAVGLVVLPVIAHVIYVAVFGAWIVAPLLLIGYLFSRGSVLNRR
jgi:hypothetical protein